jgi:hypothetical protein
VWPGRLRLGLLLPLVLLLPAAVVVVRAVVDSSSVSVNSVSNNAQCTALLLVAINAIMPASAYLGKNKHKHCCRPASTNRASALRLLLTVQTLKQQHHTESYCKLVNINDDAHLAAQLLHPVGSAVHVCHDRVM